MRAAALLLVAGAGCQPALVPGAYTCNPDEPEPCPPNWYCQIRQTPDWRCYDVLYCGDGQKDDLERCDRAGPAVPCSILGYYGDGGLAGCSADCTRRVTTGCGGGYCGDGQINVPEGEECDGLEQNGGSCSTLGLAFGGALGCSSKCIRTFDTCIGPWNVAVTSPSIDLFASDLFDVWFASPEEGFAVGPLGTILHYQSSHWSSEVARAGYYPYSLFDVWGNTGDNVYAVGWERTSDFSFPGIILHYQDHAWSPLFAGLTNFEGPLYGVWGSGQGDVYFSGSAGLFRYDESNPSQLPQVVYSTGPDAVHGVLRAVWGRGANDVYAVGFYNVEVPDQVFLYGGRIVHWNGTEAQVVHDEPNSDFFGVWGTADVGDPIYAVGEGGLFQSGDGLNWNPVPVQPPAEGAWFACIWGTSASDVFASFSYLDGARIYHFDGATWVATPSGGVPHALVSGLGGSSGNVWAVGRTGNPYREITSAVIWRYSDPPHWVAMASPTSSDLHAITGTAGGDLFAVGAKGTLLRSDGNDWAPWTSQTENDLYAAWSPEPGAVFAAGNQTLLQCSLGSCKPETLPRDASQMGKLTAIWGSSMENVFATAVESPQLGNSIWRLSGNEWTEWQDTPGLRGLWGHDPQDVLAVGAHLGTAKMAVLHYDGKFWEYRDPANEPGELTAVWGTSKSHIFAVASNGRILHYDGADWLVMPQPQPQPQALNSIWGRSAADVYAVGNAGSVQHYDGASWTPMVSGTNATLNGVWADAQRGVYAVGEGGVIVHLADPVSTLPGGDCPRPVPLYCGARPYFGDTTGAIPKFESYGCTERKLTGGEVYYRLDSPITGQIVAHLTSYAADLDLLVLGADGDGGCGECLAAGHSTPTTEALVQVSVNRDETYYIVVDGASDAPSGYTLTLDCTPQ